MKVSEIAAVLTQAGLRPLTRDQLMALAGGNAGKRFAAALRAFSGGDVSSRSLLEATVLALEPATMEILNESGSNASIDLVAAVAQHEQRRFVDAIDAIRTSTSQATSARQYLAELGLVGQKSAAPAASPPPPYYNFHIFGSSAALCVSEARTRKGNQHTVQIEGAIALGGAGVRRAFDWPNKITVQLTVQECYQVLALLENKLHVVKFDGHGRAHDKSLQIQFQESHYFVRLIQRGRSAVSVPVSAVDAIPFVSLLYKQLLANEPHLTVSHLQAMTDRLAAMSRPSR